MGSFIPSFLPFPSPSPSFQPCLCMILLPIPFVCLSKSPIPGFTLSVLVSDCTASLYVIFVFWSCIFGCFPYLSCNCSSSISNCKKGSVTPSKEFFSHLKAFRLLNNSFVQRASLVALSKLTLATLFTVSNTFSTGRLHAEFWFPFPVPFAWLFASLGLSVSV